MPCLDREERTIETVGDLPILLCDSPQPWEDWLCEHHAQSRGIWLKIVKKGAGVTSLSYSDALDVALCYGWIDGQKKPYDEHYWLQKFTPRRAKSGWSKMNTQRVGRLIESGRMTPAGLREVDAAKSDGRWDSAYAAQSAMVVPGDFLAALDSDPEAKAFFETLDRGNRYALCYRIETTKKPETRRARIDQFVARLAKHEKLHP